MNPSLVELVSSFGCDHIDQILITVRSFESRATRVHKRVFGLSVCRRVDLKFLVADMNMHKMLCPSVSLLVRP